VESVSEAIHEEEASDNGHSFSNEDSDSVDYAVEDTWTAEGLHVAEEGPFSEDLGGGEDSDAPLGEPAERGFGESSSGERDSGESAEADHDSAN
jgi:hypothetical protein